MVILFVSIFITSSDGQKGGSKTAMRNRGKSGGRGGGSRGGGGARRQEDMALGGTGAGKDDGKPRPCVGLCFLRYRIYHIYTFLIILLRKLNGEDPAPVLKRGPPCIGLCFLAKLREMKARKKT